MNYAGKKILVLGLGRSGRAAASLLLDLGARVSAHDANPAAFQGLDERVERHAERPAFDGFDAVVTSPGVPLAADPKIVPEVELAASQIDAPLIGVTGTNGKSTVTVLIGAMLERAGLATAVGGNLGTPLCELTGTGAERVVSELSSFQLEHVRNLRASVAVLLNLAPDHLDRHGSVEAYAAAKERLVELQRPEDVLVANFDDPWARDVARRARARVVGFSAAGSAEAEARVEGTDLVLGRGADERLRVALAELSPGCRAPVDNALAASAAAEAAGASLAAIRAELASFAGLPHRAQEVCVRAGVRYVDDSKATNPAAAAASLRAQPGRVVWIAGGRNKGLDFGALGEAAAHVVHAIAYGEAADALVAALAGTLDMQRCPALADAVHGAARVARSGDTVLLAPACSSFDQFESFEARGDAFARLSRALPDAGSAAC